MAKASYLVGVLVLLCGFSNFVFGQDFLLEGIHVTNWGVWGPLEICPNSTYVYAMRLKVDEDHGLFGDDSALNGIDLLCISPGAKRPLKSSINEFAVVSSSVGHKGEHGIVLECPMPSFAIGFQLRSEEDQGFTTDDTAANNLRLLCSDGTVLEGYGHSWGDWTVVLNCPRGLKVCGIQTQVEGPTDDDTTLNNVNMGCCS